MSTDTAQELINAVREVASEQPEHVYELANSDCVYVSDGAPSCIVGQGAWRLGLIDATFEDHEENGAGVFYLAETLEIEVNRRQLDWLNAVQRAQDSGEEWGRAIQIADHTDPLP